MRPPGRTADTSACKCARLQIGVPPRRPRALTLPLLRRSYTQEGYEYIVAFLAPIVAALL